MMLVVFFCISPEGKICKHSYGGPDIESCFETLTGLTARGWKLVSAKLYDSSSSNYVELPVEAFDGEPIRANLAGLKQTWKTILNNPDYFTQAIALMKTASSSIRRATELQVRVSQQRNERQRRIESLFKKADSIQSRIKEMKVEWGLV